MILLGSLFFYDVYLKETKQKINNKKQENEKDEQKTNNEPNHQTTSIGIYIYGLTTNRYRNRKREMKKAVKMIEIVL